jgi:toxin-antitoxin system PIN domain toxin
MIALDTNLLVYAHRRAAPEHKAAQRAIERARQRGRGWGLTEASVVEFLAVVTHPAAGRPSTAAEAGAFLDALVAAGARIWTPGSGFASRLIGLAADLDVTGPRVFDLQIALAAIDNGATELWTHDTRFVQVPGLRVIHPLHVGRAGP